MFADAQVSMEAAKEVFIQAVDLVMQVGWHEGKRRIQGVWETLPELEIGNVGFRRVYQLGEAVLRAVVRGDQAHLVLEAALGGAGGIERRECGVKKPLNIEPCRKQTREFTPLTKTLIKS